MGAVCVFLQHSPVLVLKATDREPVVLIVVTQVHIAATAPKAHVVRAVAIVLRRSPDERVAALVPVIPFVVPIASREH